MQVRLTPQRILLTHLRSTLRRWGDIPQRHPVPRGDLPRPPGSAGRPSTTRPHLDGADSWSLSADHSWPAGRTSPSHERRWRPRPDVVHPSWPGLREHLTGEALVAGTTTRIRPVIRDGARRPWPRAMVHAWKHRPPGRYGSDRTGPKMPLDPTDAAVRRRYRPLKAVPKLPQALVPPAFCTGATSALAWASSAATARPPPAPRPQVPP
jgi:hypothetical protein